MGGSVRDPTDSNYFGDGSGCRETLVSACHIEQTRDTVRGGKRNTNNTGIAIKCNTDELIGRKYL